MAVTAISQTSIAVGAYTNSQAQAGDAQNTPLATLQRNASSAQTQLSPFGRVKSSLADLQAKAEALKNFSKPPTLNDFKGLVQGFVQSFNNLNKTVGEVSRQSSELYGKQSQAARTLDEIRKAAGPNEASIASLLKQGVERQKDGAMSLSLKTLEKSFQADRQGTLNTFSEIADRVGKAIDKQLFGSGSIGKKVQDLSPRPEESQATRNTDQARLDNQRSFQQRLAAQLAGAGGYVARNAVATYFSVASL